MVNATITQETPNESAANNTQTFRFEYKRLNLAERKEVQKAFCKHYEVSPEAFRGRVSGYTKVSDTELAWFKKRVAAYYAN